MSTKSKKEKSKISKLIDKSDSELDENERELSFYLNDRVKLMKEVLKIIKPKRIKSMAPDCIKDLDIEEINSMLLEELLGISNKRLKYIFSGQNLDGDSSSTDPEEEQVVDIISLDDVSDDDFIIEADSSNSRKKKHNVKEESKSKKIKREKHDKTKEPLQEENLMSVLELLELQARARAIRSQLMLEASKKSGQTSEQTEIKINGDSDEDDAIIIEVPKNDEIVINSSDSENEPIGENAVNENDSSSKKITLIRDRLDNKNDDAEVTVVAETESNDRTEENNSATEEKGTSEQNEDSSKSQTKEDNDEDETKKKECNNEHENAQKKDCNDEDEIILIVDQEEMDNLIGET